MEWYQEILLVGILTTVIITVIALLSLDDSYLDKDFYKENDLFNDDDYEV